MSTVLASIAVVGVAFILFALRILLVRGGEFRGTCASNNPYLRSEAGECWGCGKPADEDCEYRTAEPRRRALALFRRRETG